MSAKKKIFICLIAVILIVAAAFTIKIMPDITMKNNAEKYTLLPADSGKGGDRIYFLDTGSADAILIESDGKYALVDAAEDSDNPRNFPDLVFEGTEEYVVSMVKKIAGNDKGEVTLEFVLGTHSHSDHIGGFDTLILDEDITVKKAYLKEYNESIIDEYEVTNWDNKEVYEQMVSACKERNVPIISDIPGESFTLGNLTLRFCNTDSKTPDKLIGENENAVGLLIEKGSVRAFLAADINNYDGDEDALAPEIGKVDLLKVGHHGYNGSTTKGFVKALSPKFAVVTNKEGGISEKPKRSLNSVGALIYETGTYGGIMAELESDKVELYSMKNAF